MDKSYSFTLAPDVKSTKIYCDIHYYPSGIAGSNFYKFAGIGRNTAIEASPDSKRLTLSITSYTSSLTISFYWDIDNESWLSQIPEDFAGFGSGTYNEISSAEELAEIAYICSKGESLDGVRFQQTEDIDLSGHYWTPIGMDNLMPFAGVYSGGGYKITGLRIDSDLSNQGLFGCIKGGKGGYATNVNVSGTVMTSGSNVGGIAGSLIDGAKVTYSTSNVRVAGGQRVGGIVGQIGGTNDAGGEVSNCKANGFVSGQSMVGGIAGSGVNSQGVKISTCIIRGTVTCRGNICGGIVGIVNRCEISDCAVFARIGWNGTGSDVGGLVGHIYPGQTTGRKIQACSFTGTCPKKLTMCGSATGTSVKNVMSACYSSCNGIKEYADSNTWNKYFAIVSGMNKGMPIQKSLYAVGSVAGNPESAFKTYFSSWKKV